MPTFASEVRCAMPADGMPLMGLLRDMHRESGVADMDEAKVTAIVQALIARDGGIIGVIRGSPYGRGGVEASCAIVLTSWWYSSDIQLQDLWNYVAAPHRKTAHAKALIGFAKAYASELGIPLLMSVRTSESGKVRFYKRQMPEFGATFLFNGPALPAPEAA